MANGFSDYLETGILAFFFKGTKGPFGASSAPPANVYFALHTADPGDTGANELTSAGSYVRKQVATDANNSGAGNFTQVTANQVQNAVSISFVTATADWNGGAAIKFISVWDASTAGNCLFSGQLNGTTGTPVLSGVTLILPINSITITLD